MVGSWARAPVAARRSPTTAFVVGNIVENE
jgi:hypothetical protein